jgi:hypothetical protein
MSPWVNQLVGVAVTATVLPAAGPVHGAVGITTKFAVYSSGYEQPATATTPPSVSDESNHPLKPFVTLLGTEVKVGVGSVIIDAVSV